MTKKTSLSPALWFIPLIAVLLAALFTLLFVLGKYLYQGAVKASSTPVKTVQRPQVPVQAPIVPFVEAEEQEPVLPPEVEIPEPDFTVTDTAPEDICSATSVPVKIQKPKRARPVTPFEQGLEQCLAGGTFPCAWEDNSK